MSDAAAARAGCAHTPQSVCIAPKLTQLTVAAALKCIPKNTMEYMPNENRIVLRGLGCMMVHSGVARP